MEVGGGSGGRWREVEGVEGGERAISARHTIASVALGIADEREVSCIAFDTFARPRIRRDEVHRTIHALIPNHHNEVPKIFNGGFVRNWRLPWRKSRRDKAHSSHCDRPCW